MFVHWKKRIKYYVLSIMVFLFIIHATNYLLPVAHAQTPTVPSTVYSLPSTVQPTSPLYTDLLVYNMFHTFSCLSIGQSFIGQPCLTYQLTQNAQGAIQGVPVLSSANLSGGLLGTTTGLIAGLYANPPVRTADYLASLGQGFGVVREANAQVVGSGAQVLSPIISLWQVSRNISYLVMIIIFVIIGLMVMFRNRINPQTVITAQAALPGLVIGLILITFSFFLAGLVSDTAFVGTNLVGAYFSAVRGKADDPQNLVQDIGSKNVLSIFSPFTRILTKDNLSNALSSIWKFLEVPNKGLLDMDPARALTALSTMIVIQLLMPFGGMLGGFGQVAVALGAGLPALKDPTAIVGLALSFIAMVILIYSMFRLLLRLINNYISIIFLTITAPFQFLAAALPGRQGIATHWIVSILGNVLAFPAVLAVFYFVAFLLGSTTLDQYCPAPSCPFKIPQSSQTEYNTFTAYAQDITIAGKETFPLFGDLPVDFINLLLAFGVLIALPKVPDLVAKAVGGLSEAGQLLGQEIGSSVGAGRGYAGQFQQGAGGMAGQAGRLTNETYYYRDEAGNLKINPMLSRAGQVSRAVSNVKGWFGKGPKPS